MKDSSSKNCFGKSLLIMSSSIYGNILTKPALENPLVTENMNFFLGLHLHKMANNDENLFDPDGPYVTEAADLNHDTFYDLYKPFSHRLVMPQQIIQMINITEEFSEKLWLSNTGSIINSLQKMGNFEKKNLLKFTQREISLDQKIRLESHSIPITTSENILIDDWIGQVKLALCNKIICMQCIKGFNSDLVN
jgi:hypothetical protein